MNTSTFTHTPTHTHTHAHLHACIILLETLVLHLTHQRQKMKKNEQSIFNNQGAHTYNFMPIPAARNT